MFGGAEFQAERWAELLSDRHRVTVITRRDPAGLPARERRDRYEVRRLAVSRVPLWRTFSDLSRIAAAVRGCDPRPDLLLCFQTFVSGLAGVRIQERSGIPAVVWVRGEDEIRLARGATRWISPYVWRRARGVLVQSEAVRAALLEELGGVSGGARAAVEPRLAVVPNGLDLPAGPFGRGGRVLAVGRLVPQKGMDLVIEAAAATAQPLTVAGDGPERKELERRARERGADVVFEGAVPRDRLAALYRDASCVVLASRRGEGLPNVLLEAMAFARPVVATPVAGVCDLVRDGENGLLVPSGDPGALGAALGRLRDDPALAARLGAAGRATVEAFHWDAVRARLEPLLERWAAP